MEHEQPASAQNAAPAAPQAPPRVARTVSPPDLYSDQQRRRQEARKRILDDPREREQLKELTRQGIRAANRDLAQQLQLTDAEHDALIELLAEHDLQTTAMTDRDPSLGYPTNDYLAFRDRLERDIADLLGPERAQQYAVYEDAWQVRNQVQQLRGELSQGRPDGTAEPSVARGPAEGARELQRGHAATRSERAAHRRQGFVGRRQAHRRQRAAEILTERQLRVFAQMQDQLLARERLETRTTTLVDQGI